MFVRFNTGSTFPILTRLCIKRDKSDCARFDKNSKLVKQDTLGIDGTRPGQVEVCSTGGGPKVRKSKVAMGNPYHETLDDVKNGPKQVLLRSGRHVSRLAMFNMDTNGLVHTTPQVDKIVSM